jgi:sporulation protein YlmC with PRC-barrel domain
MNHHQEGGLQLARDVLDKEILDRAGFKAGKVDDIVLELRQGDLPVVQALVTQESLADRFDGLAARVVGWIDRRLRGSALPVEPVVIGWEHITRIDVTVHVDIDRRQVGLQQVDRLVWERWIKHLPLANR